MSFLLTVIFYKVNWKAGGRGYDYLRLLRNYLRNTCNN